MEDCTLEFSESALNAIAHKAVVKGTGARGLRSIVEQTMLEVMYELPEQPKGSKFVIDDDIVMGRRKMFPVEVKAKSA